jgi:hypothetical protein
MGSYLDLLGKTDEELSQTDPLVVNLLVARSIPALQNLDIPRYQAQRDAIAAAVAKELPNARRVFGQNPGYWKNDLNFIHLAVLCKIVEQQARIAYKEDQRDEKKIRYTDPADLFLNGVLTSKQGTCGNMAALLVAVAWKLGWPLKLACVKAHYLARYDDGQVTYNVEATQIGAGYRSAFKSDPDDDLMREHRLPPKAVSCGSDLRALTPRETLGVFVGLRGRHMRDIGNLAEAQKDFLLARYLFPASRHLYFLGTWLSIQQSVHLFEDGEEGMPQNLAEVINLHYGSRQSRIGRFASSSIDIGSDLGFG